MEEDLQSTKVNVCGRSYPVRVGNDKVELIQTIAREINQKVRTFQSTYKDRDMQDCMAMALLTYAMDLNEVTPANSGSDSEVEQKLKALERVLDSALS